MRRLGLQLSSYVALLVGMFLIYNAIGVAVAQRRRELGLLRALGVLRRGVLLHLCAEAGLLAIPGSALGLLFGQVLVGSGNDQALEAIRQDYTITPETRRSRVYSRCRAWGWESRCRSCTYRPVAAPSWTRSRRCGPAAARTHRVSGGRVSFASLRRTSPVNCVTSAVAETHVTRSSWGRVY